MPESLIIADTSVLIALHNIQRLDLLNIIFEEVSITSIVLEEFNSPIPKWITVKDDYDVSFFNELRHSLDSGESSAIALSLKNPNSKLLIDEKLGRRTAHELKIEIIGTVGILVKAYKLGLISNLEEEFNGLIRQGFYLSEKLISSLIQKYK